MGSKTPTRKNDVEDELMNANLEYYENTNTLHLIISSYLAQKKLPEELELTDDLELLLKGSKNQLMNQGINLESDLSSLPKLNPSTGTIKDLYELIITDDKGKSLGLESYQGKVKSKDLIKAYITLLSLSWEQGPKSRYYY